MIAVALVVRGGIDAARAFDTILIQTNGGPQSASETMSLLIYRTMIRFGDPGLASAMELSTCWRCSPSHSSRWPPSGGQERTTDELPDRDFTEPSRN